MTKIFKALCGTALALSLVSPALAAKADKNAPAPAPAAATPSPVVPGIGVANLNAAVAGSNAFQVAGQQRQTTYKATYDAVTNTNLKRIRYSSPYQYWETTDKATYDSTSSAGRRRTKDYTPPFDSYDVTSTQTPNSTILTRLITGNDFGVPAQSVNGSYVNAEVANMYLLPDWSQFTGALTAVALAECGGTVTIQTKVGSTSAQVGALYAPGDESRFRELVGELLAPPLAGALGMPLRRFLGWNLLGSALWAGVSVGVGRVFHAQIDELLRALSRLGGVAVIEQLVERFYALMDNLPEAAGIRAMHGPDLAPVKAVLVRFLTEWTGGPQAYSAERGHPRLRRKHLPFAIGAAERDAWMACMTGALDGLVADPELKDQLTRAFFKTADFIRNDKGSSHDHHSH